MEMGLQILRDSLAVPSSVGTAYPTCRGSASVQLPTKNENIAQLNATSSQAQGDRSCDI